MATTLALKCQDVKKLKIAGAIAKPLDIETLPSQIAAIAGWDAIDAIAPPKLEKYGGRAESDL